MNELVDDVVVVEVMIGLSSGLRAQNNRTVEILAVATAAVEVTTLHPCQRYNRRMWSRKWVNDLAAAATATAAAAAAAAAAFEARICCPLFLLKTQELNL